MKVVIIHVPFSLEKRHYYAYNDLSQFLIFTKPLFCLPYNALHLTTRQHNFLTHHVDHV